MDSFKKLNNIFGWVAFGIAFLVYALTIEPTASFWDCGEFIASSYRLQVPHPPGAPFFLLVGRMFSLIASDPAQVAYWVNISAALCAAFTILFLFWTITMLGLKILPKEEQENLPQIRVYALIASGMVGALACTFSDSFWFSAVEAEVYAMSSFFTAFVVWAILKWERIEDEQLANRWLILLAYMVGLSIGVHILNLVTIPALGLIYYYKKYNTTRGNLSYQKSGEDNSINFVGVLATMVISGMIVILINYIIIPGLPTFAGYFEVFFVNTLGAPFGSGIFVFGFMVLGTLIFGLYYAQANKKVLLSTGLISLTFILIGYASYGIILIRAQYNPPINENDPSDLISFVSYLKREQYGDRPLAYGPTFNAKLVESKKGAAVYRKDEKVGKYVIYDYKTDNVYDKYMLFPRVYSRSGNHPSLYQQKLGLGRGDDPSMGDNLAFLFTHQLGHMYFRYFGWNFIGRESDFEGAGTLFASFSSSLPDDLARNKARNQFFAIPFILGLIGIFIQILRHEKTFLVTALLFFLTGIALVLYLNSPPVEPRERDYIYAGSYYAYTIWIGLGVLGIVLLYEQFLGAIFNNKSLVQTSALLVATVIGLSAPAIMAAEGWDDHDRSDRYHSIDSARNLLNSCAPNAIIFTGGDNDTFPLWYVQDVEGFRTDVRVCNLSLLGTDWYINQMKRQAYESAPLPISLEYDDYIKGVNDQLPFIPNNPNFSSKDLDNFAQKGMYLDLYMDLIRKKSPEIYLNFGDFNLSTYPTKRMVLRFDKDKVLAQDKKEQEEGREFIPTAFEANLSDEMVFDLTANNLFKNDFLVLNIIATNSANGWDRPIYFSSTLAKSSYLNLEEYFQQEGLAYRLLPVKTFDLKVEGYEKSESRDTTVVNLKVAGAIPPLTYQLQSKQGEDFLPIQAPQESQDGKLQLALTNGEYRIQFISDFGQYETKFDVRNGRINTNSIHTEGDVYVNSDLMTESMMEKSFYREMDNPNVYYSDTYRTFPLNLRSSFATLAQQLLVEGKKEKAKEVVNFILEKIPDTAHPYDIYSPLLAGILIKTGEEKRGMEILDLIGSRVEAALKYYSEHPNRYNIRIRSNMYKLTQVVRVLEENNKTEKYEYYNKLLQDSYNKIR